MLGPCKDRSIPVSTDTLSDEAVHFGDCCPAISKRLIHALAARLPRRPALVLSIGSGSGLLEALLLQAASNTEGESSGDSAELDLYGVEVPPCMNKYLPREHVLRVSSTKSLHPEAIFASTLMFVYPREPTLIALYLDHCSQGLLDQLVWLGPRLDWPLVEGLLFSAFSNVGFVEDAGVTEYDVLVVACQPRRQRLEDCAWSVPKRPAQSADL